MFKVNDFLLQYTEQATVESAYRLPYKIVQRELWQITEFGLKPSCKSGMTGHDESNSIRIVPLSIIVILVN